MTSTTAGSTTVQSTIAMTAASPDARVWLACQRRCQGPHACFDLFQPAVACPACGGLLDPLVDEDALADGLAARLAERRARPANSADRSGVWRFHELFWPEPRDVLLARGAVTLGEGNAAVVELPRAPGGPRVDVVCCGENPTGSFKDLGMTVLATWARRIADARAARGLEPPVLVCASTGDTSAALAAYGARAGLPVVVLLPGGKISPAQLLQPLAHGARVLALEGDFDTCMGVVAGLASRTAGDDGVLLANSKNPVRLLGQLTVALELAEAAAAGGRLPDVVCVPSGNLGNVSALHLGFVLARAAGLIERLPRLVACQVDAANPLYRRVVGGEAIDKLTASETHASAIRIGAPVSLPRALAALTATNGTVTSACEDALLAAAARADRAGLLTCPQTAAALAGVDELIRRGEVGERDHVAVVATASGLKFAEQKAAFHAGGHGLTIDVAVSASTAALRNAPSVIKADVDVVFAAVAAAGAR